MKIGIIGGGSVGLLVAGFLAKRHQVTIYVRRNEQKQTIKQFGLKIDQENAPFVRPLLTDQLELADCFIICVKQIHLEKLLPILKKIKENIPIIFLQNGMGHIPKIEILNNPIYLGVVEHGAIKKNENHVVHTGKGQIRIACYQGDRDQFSKYVDQMDSFEFPIVTSIDWKKLLHEKLIINTVINPLTAIFHVKNRMIIENEHIKFLAKQLCKEASEILDLNFEKEWNRITEIAKMTGNNKSSMLTDIQNEQETEIEAITGYLLSNYNKSTPYLSFVYYSIKALEVKNGDK